MIDDAKRLKVVLLALTGFGNTVLKSLLRDSRVSVKAVFTTKYANAFPYYPEQQLIDLCEEREVVCFCDIDFRSQEGFSKLKEQAPDLVIVSTFKQILPQSVLSLPPLGVVNLHPSLLPKYRGPSPTNAALRNGDLVTGITAHYVTQGIDEGDILCQKSIAIEEADNDGRLRKKLAGLAGEMMPSLLEQFISFTPPKGIPQDNALASLAPRLSVEDGYIELVDDLRSIRNLVRASTPLPGASIRVGNRRIAIDRCDACRIDDRADGLYEHDAFIDLVARSEALRLYKKASQSQIS